MYHIESNIYCGDANENKATNQFKEWNKCVCSDQKSAKRNHKEPQVIWVYYALIHIKKKQNNKYRYTYTQGDWEKKKKENSSQTYE